VMVLFLYFHMSLPFHEIGNSTRLGDPLSIGYGGNEVRLKEEGGLSFFK
jgi:hypothetical protein